MLLETVLGGPEIITDFFHLVPMKDLIMKITFVEYFTPSDDLKNVIES